MKFNSQICTTRLQSEKLLALGLKAETADMFWMEEWKVNEETCEPFFTGNYIPSIKRSDKWIALRESIPAWSLHRLIEIVAQTQYPYYVISKELPIYDALCERIEWLIKEGYFPKEYLV